MNPLDRFSPPIRTWFTETLGEPTPPQAQGWPAIQAGENTLILSPTGSGKTLAAFLWEIDQLLCELQAEGDRPGVRLLYISPLKALNNDIERNLRRPLEGAHAVAERLGLTLPHLRVAVRTGDTPNAARTSMIKRPPHILITTPESLYLILTSAKAREIFRTVRTVIVDEIHTVAGNKRGVHLAVSLERLAHLVDGPIQRIGLSATQRPLEEVAGFLGGQEWRTNEAGERVLTPRPVTIVDAGRRKPLDLQVVTTVADFRELGAGSIWPSVLGQVSDQIRAHHTTLIFTNGRRLAERMASQLNETFGKGAIRAHHGSMSRAARFSMEADLKEGKLPALVGTSSLELGIDIGAVDMVVQLQSPKGVARGLQRVGRSGHLVGQTSVGRIYATFREDLMECAAVAGSMLRGEVEPTRTPQNCLDILAQQIVAAVSIESWQAGALYDLFRQSYPYRDLPRSAFDETLAMLAGKYPREIYRELRPRIDWDAPADRLNPLPGSRYLATLNGGTIADRGVYTAYLTDGKTKIGELDEEFVYEQRVGTVFTLGSHQWRIVQITNDRVLVADGSDGTPGMPFWKGDSIYRPYELGVTVGRFRRQVAERVNDPDAIGWLQRDYALDENSAQNVLRYVRDQLEVVGSISSDRTIVAEMFRDPIGDARLVIQSPFGGRVNGAWAIALAGALRERMHTPPEVQVSDEGILLRFPEADQPPPLDIIMRMTPAEARERILAELPDSALFGAQFRQNAARALLMPRTGSRKRTPFWLQRLRAKDLLAATRQFSSFPIVIETYRDCLSDVLDLEHLVEVLSAIQSGQIQVVPVERATPSPAATGLLFAFQAIYQYEWDAPKAEKRLSALHLNRDLLQDVLKDVSLADLLKPEAIAELEALAQHTAAERRARSPEELATLFRELGDLSTEEVLARTRDGGNAWLQALAASGRIVERAIPTANGPALRWILAEEAPLYDKAFPEQDFPSRGDFGSLEVLVRRLLTTHGPLTLDEIRARYDLPVEWLTATLVEWEAHRDVAHGRLSARPDNVPQWCDRENLEQAHRRTLVLLRREIQPVPLTSYVDFLVRWQHVHPESRLPATGDGLRRALQQLRALSAPALLWERDLLPARVQGFRRRALADLFQTGEAVWVGEGSGKPAALRARFLFRGEGSLYLGSEVGQAFQPAQATPEQSGRLESLPHPSESLLALSADAQRVLSILRAEGACFTSDLERGAGLRGEPLARALVELVAAGLVTNDSLHALAELVHLKPGGAVAQPRQRSSLEEQLAARMGNLGPRRPTPRALHEAKRKATRNLAAMPQVLGRWSLVQRIGVWGGEVSPEEALDRQARQLLARYGIVTRECLEREALPTGWGELYDYLQVLEMRGEVRRGYFVQGLAGAQFALPDAVERLREWHAIPVTGETPLVLLNAWDPAWFLGSQVLGSLQAADGGSLAVPRRASAYAVLQRGQPIIVAERWGRSLHTPADAGAGQVSAALHALFAGVSARSGRHRLTVDLWNSAPVLGSPGQPLLEAAGAHPHEPGMEWEA